MFFFVENNLAVRNSRLLVCAVLVQCSYVQTSERCSKKGFLFIECSNNALECSKVFGILRKWINKNYDQFMECSGWPWKCEKHFFFDFDFFTSLWKTCGKHESSQFVSVLIWPSISFSLHIDRVLVSQRFSNVSMLTKTAKYVIFTCSLHNASKFYWIIARPSQQSLNKVKIQDHNVKCTRQEN